MTTLLSTGEIRRMPSTAGRSNACGSPSSCSIRTDKNRFSDGSYGILYVGKTFDVALFETMHHDAQFLASTTQQPGWTLPFREIVVDVNAQLHDIRELKDNSSVLVPDDHTKSQILGANLRGFWSKGIVYPSVRQPGGECVGLSPQIVLHALYNDDC